MTGSLTRYYREFRRGNRKNLFTDKVADQDFQNKNFIDFFGKTWIPQNTNSFTFDSVVKPFFADPNTFFEIFAVSDGSVIQSTKENPWLKQSIRFVAVAAGSNDGTKLVNPFDNNGWTLFIVAGSLLERVEEFLQVACWDGKAFRYYESALVNRDDSLRAWIFLGDSTQAFGEQAYLGPFNGHVNGSLVMKELERPWIHWLADGSNFTNMISSSRLANFDKYPYLTDSNGAKDTSNLAAAPLSKVKSAELLQGHITAGVNRWYAVRKQTDFLDDKMQPRAEVKNVKRWLAHVLLSTTVNIGTSQRGNSPNQWIFDQKHFYNTSLFGLTSTKDIAPVDTHQLVFHEDSYGEAANKLRIALVQSRKNSDTKNHPVVYHFNLANGQNLQAFVAEYGEGEHQRFNILQSSYEDFQGANILLTNCQQKQPLMSKDCLLALLMVDPWNPIYSWRRGVLMQYVPETTKLIGTPAKYDLESVLEAAVRASPRYRNEPDSPEQEFIQNLDARRSGTADFSQRMTKYLTSIEKRLQDPNQVKKAMLEYLSLAESRRRIYRPLPLDEFDLALPFATVWPEERSPSACLEMKNDGTVQNVPCRGRKFFINWIKSLSGGDPQMIPPGDKDDTCTDITFFTKKTSADATPDAIQPLELMHISSSTSRLICQSSYDYATRLAQCPRFQPKEVDTEQN